MTKSRSIRLATSEDAPILAAAEREIALIPGRLASRPEELKDDVFRDKIIALSQSDSGTYLVLEEDSEVVGHGILDPLKLAVTAHVVVLTLAIHEGHQGKGHGQFLMEHLIAWARANARVEKIELQVRSSNFKAIELYRKLGFAEEGRKLKRLKYGPDQYLDDVYMGLWVGPSSQALP